MSTRVLAGDSPERDYSMDHFLGLLASTLPALVKVASDVVELQPASKLAAADRPDWWTDGTLPGVMAGKRPAL